MNWHSSIELESLALTDINNTSACLNFLKMAGDYGLKPVIGIDFRNGVQQQYVGLAKNNEGFRQLNEHLSVQLHRAQEFKDEAPPLPDCFIIYPFEKIAASKKTNFRDNEFIGVSVESLRKLRFSEYVKFDKKLVLLQSVSFRSKKDYNAHRLLRAIDKNTLLSQLPKSEQGSFSEQMLPLQQLQAKFEDFPHILENTQNLMDSCKVEFGFGKEYNRNLRVFGNSERGRRAEAEKPVLRKTPATLS